MIVFWIVAGLFLAGALLLLLPSLWSPKTPAGPVGAGGANVAVYRDQLREAERDLAADLITRERYEQTRAEIERRVLEDTAAAAALAEARPSRRVAVMLALGIPLASVLTYLVLGRPDAAAPDAVAAARSVADGRHEVTADQLERMVTALAERLKSDPNNAEGWVMLGRSYTVMQRYRDATMAMRKASELLPDNVDILADLADVTGMAQGRRLAGEPARLIQKALDLNPRHVKALALAGSVAFEQKDYAAARRYWERLVAEVPPDSEMARSVRGSIAEATQLEGGGAPAQPGLATAQAPARPAAPTAPPGAAPGPSAGGAAAPPGGAIAAAGPRVSGQVVVSPELATRFAPGDTLFVYARAAQGPRMPLAILRRQASELPLSFSLDDSMAMTPTMKISGFPQVIVEARISKSGQATVQSGDLIGQSAPVAPGAEALRITIDRVQP